MSAIAARSWIEQEACQPMELSIGRSVGRSIRRHVCTVANLGPHTQSQVAVFQCASRVRCIRRLSGLCVSRIIFIRLSSGSEFKLRASCQLLAQSLIQANERLCDDDAETAHCKQAGT